MSLTSSLSKFLNLRTKIGMSIDTSRSVVVVVVMAVDSDMEDEEKVSDVDIRY